MYRSTHCRGVVTSAGGRPSELRAAIASLHRICSEHSLAACIVLICAEMSKE